MRNLRAAALIVALSVMVAACGTTGPTTGPNGPAVTPAPSQDAVATVAPSSAPSATPAPTPVDVAALTAATLADPELTAKVAIDATTKLGTTKTTTTGKVDIDGRASHMVRRDKVAKATTTTETITGNGTRYLKVKGVWTKAGTSDDTELIAVVRGVSSMTDLGVEDKDGAQLHHLQATTVPAVPKELSPATKGVTELTSTLDAWVTEAGVPVTMTLASTWKQKVAKKTLSGTRTADFAWSEVGGDVTVTVPTDTWKFFTSTRYHYRMGYPETWEVKAGKGRLADSYYGGEEYVYASRARQSNATLSFLNSRILGELKSITGYKNIKVTANKKTKLDGVPARRVEFRGTSSGDKVYGQAVYAIKGAFWYFVGFDAYTKQDKASRSLFSTFIKTYDFK
jgi:hypothetical protein